MMLMDATINALSVTKLIFHTQLCTLTWKISMPKVLMASPWLLSTLEEDAVVQKRTPLGARATQSSQQVDITSAHLTNRAGPSSQLITSMKSTRRSLLRKRLSRSRGRKTKATRMRNLSASLTKRTRRRKKTPSKKMRVKLTRLKTTCL